MSDVEFLRERKTLSRMVPYVPGRSIAEVMQHYHGDEPILKLASNETPLGCPVTLDELAPAYETIHHYPHQISTGLFGDLSKLWSLPDSYFVLGNGSDELISFTAFAYVNPQDEIITSQCTFSEYRFATFLMDAVYIEVPLRADYSIDLDGIIAAITPQTKVIYLANPNNPTGLYFSVMELTDFIKRVPSSVLVVIDEAYADFVSGVPSVASGALVRDFNNVVLLRTFSKLFGLAGFRIGYAVANPTVILQLKKTAAPFNVNTLSLVSAKLALGKAQFIERSILVNETGKHYLYDEFNRLGLRYLPSQANFIFVFTPVLGKIIFEKLLDFGIVIRALDTFGMPYAVRITVGLPDQNRRLIQALNSILLGL